MRGGRSCTVRLSIALDHKVCEHDHEELRHAAQERLEDRGVGALREETEHTVEHRVSYLGAEAAEEGGSVARAEEGR
jgi:hypothetical protein